MEILQLKYFCDAAKTQNFSKTAKNFLVPPSNISQTIKRLEKELETPLFERQANKIKLNDSGLLFYRNAKSALDLLENAENSLKKSSEIKTIKINIHITRRVVMEVIENYRKLHPEISFITVHSTDEMSDEFDIIVTDKELDLPYLKTKAAEENFLLAYNKTIFVLNDNITSFELKNLPFITMGESSSIYEHTLRICNRLGFPPNIVLQSEDPFYIRKCVELGLGIAIIPELSWRGQFSEEIALKNIGESKRKIYVYKKYSMNEDINEFFAMLIEKFSS
ncbi:MAG: LysR family transcriptional regulator [Ruminococcaceae bacterium]|nr:LysR family transcriptional regulator [Oscillospiraceae bacterium]